MLILLFISYSLLRWNYMHRVSVSEVEAYEVLSNKFPIFKYDELLYGLNRCCVNAFKNQKFLTKREKQVTNEYTLNRWILMNFITNTNITSSSFQYCSCRAHRMCKLNYIVSFRFRETSLFEPERITRFQCKWFRFEQSAESWAQTL